MEDRVTTKTRKPKPAPQTFGQRLRAAREAAGLTQAQLAERVGDGLTQGWVSTLERDQASPQLPMLRRLAAALELSPGDLL